MLFDEVENPDDAVAAARRVSLRRASRTTLSASLELVADHERRPRGLQPGRGTGDPDPHADEACTGPRSRAGRLEVYDEAMRLRDQPAHAR